MLPTFIIAGAAKSGTTALHEVLNSHPEICMSWMKGPTYFTEEASRSTHQRGKEWYERLFSECVNAQAIGEVSPFYMTGMDAPELIYGTVPKVKLLFVLRNPIDRLYSYYRYSG